MRATRAVLLRQLGLLLLLLVREAAGSGPLAASSDPPPGSQLSGATTPAAGLPGSSSRDVAVAAAAARLPPWERESSVPWAPPVSSSTSEPAAAGHTSSPVIGRGHQTLRSSDIAIRTSTFPVDNMDSLNTVSRNGERTLLSITNNVMPTTAPESTTSSTEIISSADFTQLSSSVEQSRRNSSTSGRVSTETGMEPLTVSSSEIPTHSSSQSGPPAIGSNHQTASIRDMEKKIPSSRDDAVHISPTFSRGAKRTLQLLTNPITSTNSLKNATSQTGISMSSDLTHSSPSVSWSGGSNRSSAITHLPGSSTGHLLIHSSLKNGFPAIKGHHQPVSSSISETKFASSHTASTYISATSNRAGERTLQSLINSSRSYATRSSTSGTEASNSSYFTKLSSVSSVALTGGTNISLDVIDFTKPLTDPLLTQSHSASKTASKAIGNSHQPINISEKRTTDLYTSSTYTSASFTSSEERTLKSLMNSISPDVADSSSSNLGNTESSDLPHPLSPVAQTGGNNTSSSDFTEHATDPLLGHSSNTPSYLTSLNGPAAKGSSHRPISISATENAASDFHVTHTQISVKFSKGGDRTLRSITNNTTSPGVAKSPTTILENMKSSDLTLASTSEAHAEGSNASSSDFTDPSVEALLTRSSKRPSYSSSPKELAALGNSHQPNSTSATEKRTSDIHPFSTYISTTLTGDAQRTLTSINTLLDKGKSSTSNLQNTTSSDLLQPLSPVAQTGEGSISSRDFTEPSTEPLLPHSSNTPNDSSSPNDRGAIGSHHQPINISSAETRTSDLHSSSTYIPTTSSRVEKKTVRSLTHSSTLNDVEQSSIYYLQNTSSSDLPQTLSHTAQPGGSSSSLSDFNALSSEPLLMLSSKTPRNIHISTAFTTGGERTLTSVTSSSLSPDVAESSTSPSENTKPLDLTLASSSVAQAGGSNIATSDFTDASTEALLTRSSKSPSYSSSLNELPALGSSHQPISTSATEKRTSDIHPSSTYILTTLTGATQRTLTSINTLLDVAESSTSNLQNTTSSDLLQPSSPVVQTGEGSISSRDFTEPSTKPLLSHSSNTPSDSSSPNDRAAIGSSHQPISISAAETRTSDSHSSSTYIPTTSFRDEKRRVKSLTHSSTLPDVEQSSTFYLQNTSSSDLPQTLSHITQPGGSSSSLSDFTALSPEPLHRLSSKTLSNTHISTTFTRGGERTLRSVTSNSLSPEVAESSTSPLENTKTLDLTLASSSVAQAGGSNISSSDFTDASTEALLTRSSKSPSYSSSPNELAALGSSHQPNSTSAAKKRTSDSHPSSTYISTTLTGAARRTSTSINTLLDEAVNFTSYLQNTTSSGLPQPSSPVAQTGEGSISSRDFTEPSTEPLLPHSSNTASDSSSPNDRAAIGSSHQPISISAAETRTSDLHNSSTYIPTSSFRGEKRTVRSLTHSSTLHGVTDGSASYFENTSSSELPQVLSSVAHPGGSKISSSYFTVPSTEPLLTLSSKSPSDLSSPNDLEAMESSHQPVSVSATETRTTDLRTDSTHVSVMLTGTAERTLTSATNSSSGAAEISTVHFENTMSSDLSQPLSSVTQTGGSNVSSSDFTEPSTEPLLTHSSKIPSYSSSPNGLADTHISTTSTGDGDRTLMSVTNSSVISIRNSSTSPEVAESSTSNLENTEPADLTLASTSVAQAGGSSISSRDFTDPSTEAFLTQSSKSPSYSSSPNDLAAMESSHQPLTSSATETRTSDLHSNSTYISITFTSVEEKTVRSLTNSTLPDARQSSPSNLENTKSSDLSQPTSSVTQTGGSNISSSDFTEPSREPSFTRTSRTPTPSSSSNDLSGVGSSHRSVTISAREKGIDSSPTHSMYVSTAFTRGGERTYQSQTPSSTSTVATEISTHNTDAAKSSDSTQFLSSVSQAGGFNISSSDADFTEPSTEPLLTSSSKISTLSLPNDALTFGSNHQSISSSDTEKRISSSYTDSTYSSATFTGSGERASRSLTNSTSNHTTESSILYTEIANSSELIQSSSVAQTRGTSISANDAGFTETFFIRSSKTPTYSSFQSDPSSIANSHQPISSIETEKRTSASRTDSMYISTTFSRGGDRTLLSISNNSTSAESSESSTFYAQMSNSSDLAQSSSSMGQSRGSNVSSSEEDLIAPSTEPLVVHSSKMPTYSTTVTLQNTTLFFTGTESSPVGSSSLSSSAFPSSSSASSLHPLPSSTPPPPPSFASSESSLPSSSSAIRPSSLPPLSLSSSSTSSSVTPFPLSSSSLPSSSSQAGDSFQTSLSKVTSEGRERVEPSTPVLYESTPSTDSNYSRPHLLKESTTLKKTTGPLPLQTEPMEQLSHHSSSTSTSSLVTESSTGGTFVSSLDHFEKTTLLLTTAATSLSKGTQHTEMTKASTSILPSTKSQRKVFPAVELTTGKTVTLSAGMTFGPPRSLPTTGHSSTPKTRGVQTAATATLAYVTEVTTKTMETSTATSIKITEENIPATHPPKMSSSSKTTTRFSTTLAAATKPTTVTLLSRTSALVTSSHITVNMCSTNPCLHDGKCVINGVLGRYQCKCSPAWQGEDCSEDVDECLTNPCPALATCNNTQGSYICKCPLGYRLEKGKCSLVRTFVGQVALEWNTTHGKYSDLRLIEDEIITMLNMSLSTLPGYYNSIVKAAREYNSVRVSVQITFSLASSVMVLDIISRVQTYIIACKTPAETCQFISNFMVLHTEGGLCKQKDPKCDTETSECTDLDGIAVCQCKSGYFKYNKMDHSCRACEDGYRLENETCVRCPFGLGGFNCRNPYQLITVVIAAAGGGLLLILGIALIVTCCQKNKNDISKLIFKSGDFQMSPYAEYPKNPRTQEWGREAIEMQENGSTKNLLQMTDVYYSPTGLRNSELERNGLYPPYTGLPGSRHSCIYPGQYNPSFISDETRRRDYF
ncbi:protein HEG homolog 1 isoform X2 [Carettochelys insculpta]|uniref:protein HEG homolog 1 isoform X2 n=1 Tax=Carettochelys insculpta TaxID=44489 RepID=UPI003EC125B5